MAKTRSDSTIAQLTDDQRDLLFDWLGRNSYADVIELAARPVGEGGLGLKLHRNTLVRFREEEASERRIKHFAELAATTISGNLPPDFNQNMIAAKARYAEATYKVSKAADDPENYDRLQRAIHHYDQCALKCRELELEKERIELAQQRFAEEKRQFEFNAAREALTHHMKLEEVAEDPQLDNEDKIWKAREICFGRDPNAAPRSALQPSTSNMEPVAAPAARTQIHTPQENTLGNGKPVPGTAPHLPPSTSNMEPLAAPAASTQIHAPTENTPFPTEVPNLQPSTLNLPPTAAVAAASTH